MSHPHSKWASDPRGPYIRMHSGDKFYLLHPESNTIRIPDVAYHLAGINRYTGASRMSVAQHCVVGAMMAQRFYPSEKLLPARVLIHDVGEYAYGDMSAPLKSIMPAYKELEARMDLHVENRFELQFVGDPLVKEVDDRMWLTERLVVYRHATEGGVDISEDYTGPLEPFPLSAWDLSELFGRWSTKFAAERWIELLPLLPVFQ